MSGMDSFLGRQAIMPVASDGRAWTPQQLAIFDAVANGTGNIAVQARAGAGKSTAILESASKLRGGLTAGLTAFNKSIADELRRKAPRGLDVKTFHAAGLGILKQHDRSLVVDPDKGIRIAQGVVGSSGPSKFAAAVRKAAAMLKANLVIDLDAAVDVLEEYDIETTYARPRELAQLALKAMESAKQMTGVVDFDDQVWLPLVLDLKPKYAYDVVFIDEAQDMAENQLRLSFALCAPGGRIVVVFDKFQAIYSWRGAGAEMFERILGQLNAKELPLSVTFRCAKAIVREANKYVPDLEHAPGAEEGKVERIQVADMMRMLRPGDVVLSRSNNALVRQCTAAIRAGIRSNIMGRDLGQSLQAMVMRSRSDSVDELVAWVEAWMAKEVEKKQAKDQDPQPVTDKGECLKAFCEGAKSLGHVTQNIAAMFDDEDDGKRVVFSSTHRFKGMERDRVFMLADTYLQPFPKKDPATGLVSWEVSQESRNLAYVAITRAKRELYMVSGGGKVQ